jgi:hypothetical protein
MKKKTSLLLLLVLLTACSITEHQAETRDVYQQPFARTSIWNMPIGSDAEYVPAGIGAPTQWGVTADEDIIILAPGAPLMDIFFNGVGWSDDTPGVRCEKEGDLILQAPIPEDFYIPHSNGTPNNAAAILGQDGRTIYQVQPLHRCEGYDYATALVQYPSEDIYGAGIDGAHGGSGMSSIGGTLRLGELMNDERITHALKVNLYARKYLAYNDDGSRGYRWPAVKSDGYADNETYGGTVPALEMGALLALKPDFDLASMQTVPGKVIAQAFIDYGGYVVDDTYWDVFALAVEESPEGSFHDQFEAAWGYPFSVQSLDHPWAQDMTLIFRNLHVIDNNGPNTIGGGGEPRRPLAPAVSPDSE